MAASSTVGTLRVILGGDVSGLKDALGSAASGVSAFSKAAAGAIGYLTPSINNVVNALGGQIKSAVDVADKTNKAAQSAGLTTEEFSKLSYAAELSDVSSESLGKSMAKLSKNMVSAASDGAGPAGQAFAALGVYVRNTDGTLKDSSVLLGEVADKFAGYRDGAAKTALAVALFGKSGAEMIPLLNQGKAGLEDAGDEAERFGLVLDKRTTTAAEAFNDNLKRMDKIKEGLVMTVTAKLLPSFEHFSEVLLEARQNSTFMSSAAEGLTNILKGIASAAIQVTAVFQGLFREAGAFSSAYKEAGGGLAGLQAGWAAMNAEGERSEQVMADVKKAVDAIWAGPDQKSLDWTSQLIDIKSMQKEVQGIAAEWGKVAAPVMAADGAVKNALLSFLDSQAKRTAGQLAEAATVGKSVGEQAKLRVEYEAQAIALSKNIPLTDAMNLRIAQAGDAAALAAMKIQGAQVTQEVMNPAEQFAQKMEQQRLLFEAGVISLDTYGKKQQQIAEQAGATWDLASASIAGSFATIAGAFGKESSAMATAAKVFGIIQGTISMYTGAAKALELPFPANIAAVAAVLAKGASLVASIKSQSVPTGYMTGGSFTVGGAGGPDSTPVSFMASPGEQVDIWRPDQGGGADPRGRRGESKTVNLYMPLVATRDAMFAIIDGLNDAIADGARLKIVPA